MKSRREAAFRNLWGSGAIFGSMDETRKYFYNRAIKLNAGAIHEY